MSRKWISLALLVLPLSLALPATPTSHQNTRRTLSYGILVDNSKLLTDELDHIKTAAREIIEANAADDETFIVFFEAGEDIGVFPELRTGKLAENKAELLSFLQRIKAIGQRKALVDAMFQASDFLIRNKDVATHDRALVLITDGKENSRYYNTSQLLAAIRDKVPVFVLGLNYTGGSKGSNRKAIAFLQEVADKSGGKLFIVEDRAKVEVAAKEVVKGLRSN